MSLDSRRSAVSAYAEIALGLAYVRERAQLDRNWDEGIGIFLDRELVQVFAQLDRRRVELDIHCNCGTAASSPLVARVLLFDRMPLVVARERHALTRVQNSEDYNEKLARMGPPLTVGREAHPTYCVSCAWLDDAIDVAVIGYRCRCGRFATIARAMPMIDSALSRPRKSGRPRKLVLTDDIAMRL